MGRRATTMPKRHDEHEEWAIRQLQPVVDLDRRNRDALPGSAVKFVKRALLILKARRRGRER